MDWHLQQANKNLEMREFHIWAATLISLIRGDTMKLTKRGKRVRAVAILLAAWAIWQISGHLWWVEDHYCWGSNDRML
jgi:hypothetical protein